MLQRILLIITTADIRNLFLHSIDADGLEVTGVFLRSVAVSRWPAFGRRFSQNGINLPYPRAERRQAEESAAAAILPRANKDKRKVDFANNIMA